MKVTRNTIIVFVAILGISFTALPAMAQFGAGSATANRQLGAASGNKVKLQSTPQRPPVSVGSGSGLVAKCVLNDPNANSLVGGPYYSPKLRAKFVVVPGGGRAVTQLHPGSPLWRAGIEVGDIITHLDGIPVHSNWELENHYSWTHVYGIDWRTGDVFTRKIYLP